MRPDTKKRQERKPTNYGVWCWQELPDDFERVSFRTYLPVRRAAVLRVDIILLFRDEVWTRCDSMTLLAQLAAMWASGGVQKEYWPMGTWLLLKKDS